jgi:hypothetical protein
MPMSKTRVSDEWVVGATVGAYAVLTFVLYFWGTAFMHFWCGNSYESVFTKDGRAPGSLALLIPGALVGVMDWGQIKVARQGALRERAMRAALWMNLVGILGFLIAYSSNYGPDRDNTFFVIVSLVAVASGVSDLERKFGVDGRPVGQSAPCTNAQLPVSRLTGKVGISTRLSG